MVTYLQKTNKVFRRKSQNGEDQHDQETLVFLSALSVSEAIENQSFSLAVRKICLINVSLTLREDIMQAEHNPLPENVNIHSLAKGENSNPDSLKEFLHYLIAGPDTSAWHSNSEKKN